ncbi:hypothetical protein F5Y18DRAFT_354119 [Xylariaceae sp. FL1019]|nr:hypothetical protein F5Y18DRAFT_354119 [Xylariaceae sp. FL1019]
MFDQSQPIVEFDQARDLRGATREFKRHKDHQAQWAHGKRNLAGVKFDLEGNTKASESMLEKKRPDKAPGHYKIHAPSANVNKAGFNHWRNIVPQSHIRGKHQKMESNDPANLSESLRDLLPSPPRSRKPTISEDFLYSFDKTESPGKPLSLDAYIKTNPRDMEKLVEREWMVVDNNGEAVKGRKARMNLRHGKSAPLVEEPELIEDDGFELL